MDDTTSGPLGDLITADHDDPDDGAAPHAPSSVKHPDGILTGLSAIIADRLGLDPLWVRLAFVLLTLVGGLGLVVYLGLWLLLVVGDDGDSSWARLLGGAVLLGGVPVLISETDLGFASGTVAIVALLGGLAVALWRSPSAGDPRQPLLADGPSNSSPLPPPGATPGAWHQVSHGGERVPRPVGARRAQRPPSLLGRLALASAVVVGAAGALIDELNGGRLHPEQWLGAAAIVCGLGLVVGALRGHARWLIVPAVALAVAGYGGGLLARSGVGLADLAGERYVSVSTDSPSRLSTSVGFGALTADVNQVPNERVVLDATVAVGTMEFFLADNVAVEVRADLDNVELHGDGRRAGDDLLTFGPDRTPDVIVNATMLLGTIDIHTYRNDGFVGDDQATLPADAVQVDTGQFDQVDVVADGVGITSDGWLVLGDREVILDSELQVVVGNAYAENESTLAIDTMMGTYRIFQNRVLITPQTEMLDLDAVRSAYAENPPSSIEPQQGEG